MTTISILFNKNNPEGERFSYTTTGGTPATDVKIKTSGPIYWAINSNSVPSGVTFGTPGIQFRPDPGTTYPWPEPQPTEDGAKWTVYDTVSNETRGTYAYTINLVTPGGTLYSHDPDVTNTPQG